MQEQAGGRVVVLGSINVDVVATVARHPLPGQTVLGTGGLESPGGKGANQAVAAALAGASVMLVGAVGSDPRAEVALAGLRAAGCDVSRVRRVPGATGLALITVARDAGGENSIVVVPAANGFLGPADVGALAHSGGLRADDVLVLQGEIPASATATAVLLARECGARVCLNLAPVVDLPVSTLCLADPLVVNAHEAAGALQLWGVPAHDVPDVARDPGAAAELLRRYGVRSVVLTLGAAGAVVVDDAGATVVPAVPADVVDTTGAGDAFVGACAAALARGASLAEAATAGARLAARAVAQEGAQLIARPADAG